MEALRGDGEADKTDEEILKEIKEKEARVKKRIRNLYKDTETSAMLGLFRRAAVIYSQHLEVGEGAKARKAQMEVYGIAYELQERKGLFGLAKFLRDRDETVRLLAAIYVKEFIPEEAKRVLQVLTKSEEPRIRINAENALQEIFDGLDASNKENEET